MNLKTTLILLVLVAAGGGAWLAYDWMQPAAPSAETTQVLRDELAPAQITRVEVTHGDRQVVLEKAGNEWSLPGRWPVRGPEVKQLLDTLTTLHSRFEPIPVSNAPDELKRYGLDEPLVVKVRAGGKDYTLSFGEEPGESNRFSRPTFLRLDKKDEVVRLAPGLVGLLDRPQEHYMQRRLFPVERVTRKEGDSSEKVEEPAAREIAVRGEQTHYALARAGDQWELREPVHDRPDPEKLKKVLNGIPDLWVERFVDRKGKGLEEFGLEKPGETLSVTRPGGGTITLQVGKVSDTKMHLVKKAAPPGNPFMPQQPQVDFVREEFRFAKLQDNDQVFEIKGDRLKDLMIAADSLRDPQLAHFKSEDARRVEVDDGGRQIVLVKSKDDWRMEKPGPVAAEGGKVTELLDKLSGLQAQGGDVLDKADPKAVGLDHPAVVKVTLEEGKDKKAREVTFRLGKHDTEKNKQYVQVAGRERVNAVEADVGKLVGRPALAYRNRRVLDLAEGDMARIEVQRGSDAFTLEQVKGAWKLAAPVQAELDGSKTDQLARELSHLEAADFITDSPKSEELDTVFGLAKPALSVKVVLKDARKPAPTVLVGKQRAGKQEYYARLDTDPAVFALRKDAFETLDRDALAYRKLELWHVPAQDVAELGVGGARPEYTLKREGVTWKITGPFEAPAAPDEVRPMTEELSTLRAERFVANTAKDLGKYGLDRPYLRVAVKGAARKDGAKDESKVYVLLVGKETDKGAETRYARLGDGEAVFVVGEKTVAAADHAALDLLDRRLLTLDLAAIRRIHGTGAGPYTLERDKGEWRVVESPAPPFVADKEVVSDTLRAWSLLRAQRFAAYGGKLDLAPYGLDKPTATATVTLEPIPDKGKPGKAVVYTLALGKQVEGDKGARYARLDAGQAVVVLDAGTAEDVGRSYLDFVNHTALKLDAGKVSGLLRRAPAGDLEVVKKGEDWRLVKPADQPADRPTLEMLVEQLAELRARRIAAYPAKDLAEFGLANPVVVTLKTADDKGKPAEHTIEVGGSVEKGKEDGDHFARVDRSDAVLVLAADLAKQLLAAPLEFRDRNLVKAAVPTKATVERGLRKVVFAEEDGTWKMTGPVEAEAEGSELQAFVKAVSRLRADRLVAEKPGDLKPYGLDRPQARWGFAAGGKEELTLLVGGFEKGGKHAYAKLEKGDLVFLLDERLTGQALAEYRSRKVWAPLDAVQVEKLHFGYPKDGFVLEKVGDKWQVAGRPDAKVNEAAVRDALDALARLQADHFAADKGGDRKLFGLEPPALSLEVETTAGKRTLLIGRQEGGSGGYYAAVAGMEGAPVFAIAAAEAGKIVRPLEAFVERPGAAKPAEGLPRQQQRPDGPGPAIGPKAASPSPG